MARYQYHPTSQQTPKRFRSWGLALVCIGLAVVLGIQKFRSALPGQIHNHLQSQLDQTLGLLGLNGSLRAVEFQEGKGFRISDLCVTHSSKQPFQTGSPVLEIYEGFVHARAAMTDIVAGNVKVHSVDIRGAKLTISRDVNGKWNLQDCIQRLNMNQDAIQSEVAMRFYESEIKIIDNSHVPPNVSIIRDINLNIDPVIHEGRKLIQFTGSFTGIAISHVTFKAYLDPVRKTWFTDIQASQARLSRDLLRFIPAIVPDSIFNFDALEGIVDLQGSADGDLTGEMPLRFGMRAQIRGLMIEDSRLPFPIRDCAIDAAISHDRLEISRATGQLGRGRFDVSYFQPDLFNNDRWSTAGKVDQLEFSEKLHSWLPESCKEFCRDFKPRGTSNIIFQMTQDADKLTRNIQSQITNMSFDYYKFPFLFENCSGRVSLINEDCNFDIESVNRDKRVRFTGKAKNPGPDSTYVVDVTSEGNFPIDEKLIAALEPNPGVKHNVLAFRPLGHVTGSASFVKNSPEMDAPVKSIDMYLRNCTVRHRNFEYPIGNVNGLVRIRGNHCEFENVTGANGMAKIRCDGTWEKSTGLELRFLCNDVPLDENLRSAVSPNIQSVWQGFRPRGSVALMRVELTLPPGQKECNVAVEADLESTANPLQPGAVHAASSQISIYPVWFPYDIGQLGGKVKIGNGRVTLTDMKGTHRRTWMAWQGDGVYSNEGWTVSLKNLLVGSLRIDDELLAALPPTLSPSIEQLEFQGLVNVNGEITLGGRNEYQSSYPASQIVQVDYETPDGLGSSTSSESPTQLFWDLRFDMNQSQMLVGLPIKNVFGMVQLRGEYDGKTANCSGEVEIDSLNLQGAQITNIRGPIWIDERGFSAGTLAAKDNQQAEPRPLTGEVFNGQIRFDGQRRSEGLGQFFLQASVADGNLKEIVNEFAPHLEQIDGRSFAAIRMSGNDSGTHTYRGEGRLHFRDAEIYELPVILSLLKILRVKEVNRTAFDTSNIDFSINGPSIDVNRIELIGDAISLIGNGKINFNHQIDLNFYSVMGRNRWYIPIVSELYRAGSKRVLWIHVDGTCENPQTHRNVLPQLNDTIRNLLQPPQTPSDITPRLDTKALKGTAGLDRRTNLR